MKTTENDTIDNTILTVDIEGLVYDIDRNIGKIMRIIDTIDALPDLSKSKREDNIRYIVHRVVVQRSNDRLDILSLEVYESMSDVCIKYDMQDILSYIYMCVSLHNRRQGSGMNVCMKYMRMSVDVCKRHGAYRYIPSILLNTSVLYIDMSMYIDAYDLSVRCLRMFDRFMSKHTNLYGNDDIHMMRRDRTVCVYNIGYILSKMYRYVDSIQYLQTAVKYVYDSNIYDSGMGKKIISLRDEVLSEVNGREGDDRLNNKQRYMMDRMVQERKDKMLGKYKYIIDIDGIQVDDMYEEEGQRGRDGDDIIDEVDACVDEDHTKHDDNGSIYDSVYVNNTDDIYDCIDDV